MFDGMYRAARRAWTRAGMLFGLHCDLLWQCDLDCAHCYLDDKARRILPTDFWRDVFDQAADLGVFSVLLSGGEIFLRKDLLALVAHARSRGLFVHLKSHGGHIDADVAKSLKELNVSTVALSYYATDPAIHDAVTRRLGSHAKTRAALSDLAQAGVLTIASIPVMSLNAHCWREAVAEVEGFGAFAGVNAVMTAALSGDPFPRALTAAEPHLIEVERFLAARRGSPVRPVAGADTGGAEVAGSDDACDASAGEAEPWEAQRDCGAGHTQLYVGPEGDVTPCISWPMPFGNLARGDRLADLWRTSPALSAIKARRSGAREVCARCEVREDCNFCAGEAWLETGDPTAAIRSACEATRAKTLARAALLGLPEPPLPAGLLGGVAPPRRFPIRVVAPRSPRSDT
jgi:radical SAM protein with 4Fe4S-binding SPASM domain